MAAKARTGNLEPITQMCRPYGTRAAINNLQTRHTFKIKAQATQCDQKWSRFFTHLAKVSRWDGCTLLSRNVSEEDARLNLFGNLQATTDDGIRTDYAQSRATPDKD
jgi:hypothetical protein